MIIDFHTHVFSPLVKEERSRYVQLDACFAELYSKKEAKLTTSDELIESMDRDGVDVSVALNFGWASDELCHESNDYILESVARYPKRLIGFCAVPPDSKSAAAEIERCARGGARGVGELRLKKNLSRSNALKDFAEALVSHHMLLLLHCSEPVGHIYPGKGDTTPDVLYSFIASFPDISLVCAHWGGGLPFYGLMPEVKRSLKNVYFDTAASPFLYRPEIYQKISEIMGYDKILFGSDFPLLSQKRLITEIQSAVSDREAGALVLGDNARKLLNI